MNVVPNLTQIDRFLVKLSLNLPINLKTLFAGLFGFFGFFGLCFHCDIL